MEKWAQLAAAIYYTGVGVVLLGTGIRFLWRFIYSYNRRDEFLDELKTVHIENIYTALGQIANELNIQLELKRPGSKTPHKELWIPYALQHPKK